jgi:hypothetical protein
MDQEGNIIHGLFCEAKCLQKSNPKSIKEAHKKLSDPNLIPLDRQQLIEVLLDSRRPDKDKWILALRQLGQVPVISYRRMNLIGYVSTAPKTKRRKTWIMPDKPHPEYKDSHDLQVIEVHIPNILGLVKQVYGK